LTFTVRSITTATLTPTPGTWPTWTQTEPRTASTCVLQTIAASVLAGAGTNRIPVWRVPTSAGSSQSWALRIRRYRIGFSLSSNRLTASIVQINTTTGLMTHKPSKTRSVGRDIIIYAQVLNVLRLYDHSAPSSMFPDVQDNIFPCSTKDDGVISPILVVVFVVVPFAVTPLNPAPNAQSHLATHMAV
jgi:hypothetical protein